MLFVVDTGASRSSHDEDRIWRHLWEMRDVPPVNVVLQTVVSPACPLLAEENADSILMSTGIHVPQNTAWVPMQVDVSVFARDNGDIRLSALEMALCNCIDQGDALHDTNGWPSPELSLDSWQNRRLAVAIRGWGNLVRLRRADPGAFRTLAELEQLADFITTALSERSQALAREKGHCPSVDAAGSRILSSGSEMKLRWRRAVEQTALRHRNLTTMSAWDVFPDGEPADLRYINLLPLLRCANCLSFQRNVEIAHWDIHEFRAFYARVSAILRCKVDAGRIAKQV